jgi:hypothetical protein
MSVEFITECMNDISVVLGVVSGILFVLVFSIVWGYHKNA